ncbi:hypothetical protein [Allokutzneria oryzae]|uniref:DUF732 domain-containing protein n=1 Tax=Allokutzneria oryzae TaxID=1378989 RepID=A0ABV5ZS62_9PSEU
MKNYSKRLGSTAAIAAAAIISTVAAAPAEAAPLTHGNDTTPTSVSASPTLEDFEGWAYGFSTSEIYTAAYNRAIYLMNSFESIQNKDCKQTTVEHAYAQAGGGMWQVTVIVHAWCDPISQPL